MSLIHGDIIIITSECTHNTEATEANRSYATAGITVTAVAVITE